MNHAHIALAFTLLGTAALAGTGCTSSQNLGCRRSETCPDGEGGGGSAPSSPTGMRVFITAKQFDGNLQAAGGKATGIESANALCQFAANQANLDGHWVAWITDTTSDAVDRVVDDGPWSLVESADAAGIVYANRAAVGGRTKVNPTDQWGAEAVDWYGQTEPVSTPATFWTGSFENGRSSGRDCSGWRSAAEHPEWSTKASYKGYIPVEAGCDEWQHLLCLEQKMAPQPL